VRYPSTEVPRNQIARRVIVGAVGNWERFSLTAEKHRQIWNPAVIYIGIRMGLSPPPVVRVSAPVPNDVLVNFLLQVDSDGPVGTNNFIRADSGAGRNISARVGDPNVRVVVAYVMRGSFDRGGDEPLKECLLRGGLLSARQAGGGGNKDGGSAAIRSRRT